MSHVASSEVVTVKQLSNYHAEYNQYIQLNSVQSRNCDTFHKRDKSHPTTLVDGWRPPMPYYGSSCGVKSYAVVDGHRDNSSNLFTGRLLYPYERLSSGSPPAYIQAKLDDLANRALTSVLIRIKDRKLNLAVSLAEGRQTLRLLNTNLKRIIGIVRSIRSGRLLQSLRRSPDDWMEAFFDLWLEARYGWRPLLSDIYGAAESLEKRLAGFPEKGHHFFAKKHYRLNYEETSLVNNVIIGGSYFNAKCQEVSRISHKLQAIVRLDVSVDDVEYLTRVDLGIEDPLIVFEELLPYSFVVDWILQINKFLEAITALRGLRYWGGSKSLVWDYDRKTTFQRDPIYGNADISSTVGEESGHTFVRSVINSPHPRLIWRGIQDLDNTRIVDLAALLRRLGSGPHVR